MKAKLDFRGLTVITFDGKTITFTKDAVMCNFIPEDTRIIADFLMQCYKYQEGVIKEVENIELW